MALNGRNAGNANGDAERDPQLDRLYREAAREAPPAHLDAPILAAARRDAGARPRSLTSTLRRWHVPVSIAAVVIVSVTLVILVREEGGERIVPAPVQAVAPPAEQLAAPGPQPSPATPRMAEERAAPSPADAATAGRMAGAVSVPGEPLAGRSAIEASQAKPMARAMQAKPPEQDRLPAWHGYEKELPQKWLVRIEELKRQGQAVEAEEMLSEFKRRFPEHPLPLSSK